MEVEGGSKRKQIMKKRRDIDIEKANQLMKKSKNHSNKEAAESADKEVIVVNEKRSNDDDDDDDDASKTEDHKKPKVFQSKSNLEIVAWFVDHPEILRLALEINNTDVAISSSSKIMDDKIRLWDESVKCLFLGARSPREEFKEIRKNRASTGSLSQKELIDYVDEEFVQKILS
ncbi:uncharacterized protein OCT59_000819 [Rhizophagus irregularis]|uniref:uncharacterized protein n=1 Tax=Rhizophagus irregularis TaxID=588596 RepID=UPI000CC4341F|nr:hypothetical protein OCT59_000819 [Rhizophagus irregularis]GBC28374.1 hypothetical protein GLOIN_2v1625176 [Rhizophagus irregularis DAOM 181602=DAOM 197198]